MELAITDIQKCFENGRVRYSDHARDEMKNDEFGRIYDDDIFEALISGEIIEHYPNTKPLPACLVFGRTSSGRPIHAVFGYNSEFERTVVITVYHPDPKIWIDYKTRRSR
jgi:hypothetical protein